MSIYCKWCGQKFADFEQMSQDSCLKSPGKRHEPTDGDGIFFEMATDMGKLLSKDDLDHLLDSLHEKDEKREK
jgi:hypothetical protein